MPPFLSYTGQSWKLVSGAALIAVGAASPSITATGWFQRLVPDTTTQVWLGVLGCTVGILAMIGIVLIIRCPRCHERLLPHAVIGMPHPDGLRWFFSCKECPSCLFNPLDGEDGQP
jgi:hypothetical protein